MFKESFKSFEKKKFGTSKRGKETPKGICYYLKFLKRERGDEN